MKSESDVRIELPYAVITFKKEGIIHVHYKNYSLTLHENKKIFRLVRKNSPWERCPFLISGDEFSSHDKESKTFHASVEVMKHCSAIAFVIRNVAQKLVVNFFMRVYQPKVPVFFFNEEDKAMDWLATFEKRRNPRLMLE